MCLGSHGVGIQIQPFPGWFGGLGASGCSSISQLFLLLTVFGPFLTDHLLFFLFFLFMLGSFASTASLVDLLWQGKGWTDEACVFGIQTRMTLAIKIQLEILKGMLILGIWMEKEHTLVTWIMVCSSSLRPVVQMGVFYTAGASFLVLFLILCCMHVFASRSCFCSPALFFSFPFALCLWRCLLSTLLLFELSCTSYP